MDSELFAKGNFAELQNSNKKKSGIKVNTEFPKDKPSITELPDGEYKGIRYGYTFETEDGTLYRTKLGVRQSRSTANKNGSKNYIVKDGVIQEKHFTGFGEVSAGLQGASYGRKNPEDMINPTRVKLDVDGFRIPKDLMGHFRTKDKHFSLADKSGKFTGNTSTPSISISKDNSIIRKGSNSNSPDKYVTNGQPNVMQNMMLDWDRQRSFHLAVEPWITTPLMSDTEDGLYIGHVTGNTFDTGKTTISLAIKVNTDYPQAVVCLVKNRKAFLFKQDQLIANSGSKLFSDNSETKYIRFNESEGYWYIISAKTGKPWPQHYKSKESALAALRGYHATKGFADTQQDASQGQADQSQQPQQDQGQGQDQNQQQSQPQQVFINRSKKGEEVDAERAKKEQDEQAKQDQAQTAEQPKFETQQVNQDKVDPNEQKYSFEFNLKEPTFEISELIGTVLMSVSFGHLFHLCASEYSAHMALDEYYKTMPELVDKLAECYLSTTPVANFTICIAPDSLDPIDYFDRLREYVSKVQKDKLSEAQMFSSLVDDILQQITSTLYKLKRLKSGRKLFSFTELENQRHFSYTKSIVEAARDTANNLIQLYFKKFKKSPVKEIKTADGKTIHQFVNNNIVDDQSAASILTSLTSGIASGLMNSIK